MNLGPRTRMRPIPGVTLPVGAQYEARPRHFVRYHPCRHALRRPERGPTFRKPTCTLVATFGVCLASLKGLDSCARGETNRETDFRAQ
jgi:hypothetical protein